jgi:hypothetical protein
VDGRVDGRPPDAEGAQADHAEPLEHDEDDDETNTEFNEPFLHLILLGLLGGREMLPRPSISKRNGCRARLYFGAVATGSFSPLPHGWYGLFGRNDFRHIYVFGSYPFKV